MVLVSSEGKRHDQWRPAGIVNVKTGVLRSCSIACELAAAQRPLASGWIRPK